MKTKPKFKIKIGVMILVVILFSYSVFHFKGILNVTQNNLQTTTYAFKEEQFKVIWLSLNNLQLEAEKEVTEVSLNIEKDILCLSEDDLNKLESDMTNNIFNEDLHNILNKNIENKNFNGINNHRNGIIVMNTKGYIEDYNYRRANDTSSENNSLFREWQYSIDNSYNKELEEDAIDKLLNRTSGIIALESYNLLKNDHIMIKEMTYENLLNVFLNEGMEGLKNYQIFVPYYITDIGDVFGNPDIFHGSKVDNNKIIVVQEFNLYDQIEIMASQNEIFNNEQIDELTVRYRDLLSLLYIFGIGLVSATFILIFYFCHIYNVIVMYEYHDEDDEENEVDHINDIDSNNDL